MYKNYPITRNTVFRCFAECLFVKGAIRSTIYDLPRREYDLIPNGLYEIIKQFEGKTINKIKDSFEEEYLAIIDEYFDFLIKKDYIFWCEKEELSLFPNLDLRWDYPATITNTIIDLNGDSNYNLSFVFNQLQKLNCHHLQIRSYSVQTISFWSEILNYTSDSVLRSIEIITCYSEEYHLDVKLVEDILNKNKRVVNFIIHNSPHNNFYKNPDDNKGNIAFVTEKISSPKDCHIIDPAYFTVNIELFTEAQQHHTYFNRKISIDSEGNIKNCPSLDRSFGNIKDTTLQEAIDKPGFKDLWFVRKDDTRICRDCEFRYMCVDSREPFWDEEKQEWYHKVACPYDPYTATWADMPKEATVM